MRGNNVITIDPDHSVLRLQIGDRISLTAGQFQRFADAFFTEFERRFL